MLFLLFICLFTSAIRILIYYSCNPQIRIQIKHCLSFGSKCTSNNNVCEEEESSSNNYSYQQKQQSTTTTIYLPFNIAKNNFGNLNVNIFY
uniref:Uncharacterized protein n=1 Tax=Meloidogyne enterolobii TaxID=390850 RepID=A0A6V7XP30_MELEN|nr:unnamed protein product [Meloidogyne enterolobii]